jgi:hypothetical protein
MTLFPYTTLFRSIEVEDDIDHALDEVIMQQDNFEFHEFSQKHLEPSPIIAHYEISRDEYLKIFNEDNDYLKLWEDDKKFSYINSIDYESPLTENNDGD